MPIIAKVGRTSFRTRVLDLLIHGVLLLGAFSIVYPFLIMLSGSVKSDLDMSSIDVVPAYLYDDAILFRKQMQTKYNDDLSLLVSAFDVPLQNFRSVEPPRIYSKELCSLFENFVKEPRVAGDPKLFGLGMTSERGVEPLMLRRFRDWLRKVYGPEPDTLARLNIACGTQFTAWEEIVIPAENYVPRQAYLPDAGYLERVLEFKMLHSEPAQRYYFNLDGAFADFLRKTVARTLPEINAKLGTSFKNWESIVLAKTRPEAPAALAERWEDFVRNELNPDFVSVSAEAERKFKIFLRKKYHNNISGLDKAYNADYGDFDEIPMPRKTPRAGAERGDWSDFITREAPIESVSLTGLSFLWREELEKSFKSVDEANAALGRGYKGFGEVKMPVSMPEGDVALGRDWNDFLKSIGEGGIGLKRNSVPEYKDFVAEKYEDQARNVDFAKLSRDYHRRVVDRSEVPFYLSYPGRGTEKSQEHYGEAVRSLRFEKMRVLRNADDFKNDWTVFLQQRYKSVDALNKDYGLLIEDFASAPLPIREWEWSVFQREKTAVKYEFLTRNYAMVLETVLYNGRAALNTLIYCLLSIFAALLVNPMAAYALSRFRPPSSYKILLLLMMTIGFPSIVIGIPNFLMLKSLGLMNTYAALILPGMASGFSIFLLKGFFDSLPKELFESATLDGASERVIFWHVAMALSKPILAVTALQTFLMAYGDFMMAFLVCQNPKMWTIMVFLYQLQQRASPSVAFAALVVSAIPTLLVYLFCQNLILRGIVVPSEK